MSSHFHAVVWIDHREARVFHFNAADIEHITLHPDSAKRHIHHKANTVGSGHETLDNRFLHEVAEAISDAGAVLIVGPGNAKTELMTHIEHHDPKLLKTILGVETVDHPSDGQLLAHARAFFKTADKTQPQIS